MKEEIIKKLKQNNKDKHCGFNKITLFFSKFLVVAFMSVITLIVLKANPKLKPTFYQKVYEDNISFAYINSLYEKYFGSSIPFKEVFKSLNKNEQVFNEKLIYKEADNYLDGVKIVVGNDYLIPCIETGLVVFVGEKEGYGNTVIIEQQDGTTVWYSNLKNSSVKLYDYVKKGSYIGENKDDYMYLVFKKEGNIVDYKNYI